MTSENTGPLAITVRITDTAPDCPSCGTPALLAADMPHGWDNPDGTRTNGTLPVLLCPRCDAGAPGAAALITYFHVHGQVEAGTIEECAALIQAWVSTISIPPVDMGQLDAEISAWHRGDL